MKPRQKVFNLAASLGATIEDASGPSAFHFNIDAPDGYIWAGDKLHCLVATTARGGDWTTEMWQDAFDRMSTGIEPCDDPECDICE